MAGSEQAELYEGKKRGRPRRKIPVGTAILIVAVVGLASLSGSLWYLADHYHDSKYRSQHVLVSSLWLSLSLVNGGIDGMLDASRPDFNRLELAEYTIMNLREADDSARAIEVMYPKDSKEASAFAAIERAMTQAQLDVERYKSDLDNALRNNRSYTVNDTVNSLFEQLGRQAKYLSVYVFEGILNSDDWYEHPSSLVKRIDLSAVEEASTDLEATGIELARLIVF